MKKNLKIIVQLLVAAMLLTLVTVVVFAEDEGAVFGVTAADGSITDYYKQSDFNSAFESLGDGETLTLYSDIEMTSGVYVASTAASAKTISLDLGGHGIYSLEKRTMFQIGAYTTLNVYSSAPDAYLYVVGSGATTGGNVFAIRNTGSRVNFGEMTVGDVTYPGSNISTFSSCYVDVREQGAVGYFGNGGTHYSNIKDWSCFIGARTGDGVVEMKNSNIILQGFNALIYNLSASNSYLFENCVIISMDSSVRPLMGEVHCPVTVKDCVTNLYLGTSSELTEEKLVTLIGSNVFGTGKDYDLRLLAEGTPDLVGAKTLHTIELVEGGYDSWYYDIMGNFAKTKLEAPEVTALGILTSADKTVEYTWTFDKNSITETWYYEDEPVFPYELPTTKEPGLYRYGWQKSVSEDGKVTYTGGRVADFDICVSAVYEDGEVYYKIYVPADIVEMGYLVFTGVSIGGAIYSSDEWEPVTVGEEYYYTVSTMALPEDDVDQVIEVVLPCDFPSQKGQIIEAITTWKVTLSEYVERVLENAELYDSESVDVVREISEKYFEN